MGGIMSKPKVIVICGPTASGKTALSILLAQQIKGEIVSADSMQIYLDMNIGSAKPTEEEKQGIPHYLLDFVSPEQRYSVADYKNDAIAAIQTILQKGKTPIVVGGTGLYIDALIYGIDYPEVKLDSHYRQKLEEQVEQEGLEAFYKRAVEIDPEAMKTISKNDKKRILRILEIYHETGKNKTEQERESRKHEVPYDYHVYALTMDRQVLYERINKRVDQMIEQGLIEEVRNIQEKYHTFPTAMQALGYKEIKEYLEGTITKEEAIEKVKQETRHYAKRQLTWFRKNKQTIWLDAQQPKQNNVNFILEGIN